MELLLLQAVKAAIHAAFAVLKIYKSEFSVFKKPDMSPHTTADTLSHTIITSILTPLGIPLLSEEGLSIPYSVRKAWDRLWIIDPLDGTKEFIGQNGEFSINIALIHHGFPVMGVICLPAFGQVYFAENSIGAFKLEDSILFNEISSASFHPRDLTFAELLSRSMPLPLHSPSHDPYIIIGSRSHSTPEFEHFVKDKRGEFVNVEFISSGSALKFCRVAEGSASIYPRFGTTMEWDTAAGQAIAACAGARVIRHDTGEPLHYNKENLENPWFMVEMTKNRSP